MKQTQLSLVTIDTCQKYLMLASHSHFLPFYQTSSQEGLGGDLEEEGKRVRGDPWAQGHSRLCLTLIFIVLGARAVISFCILSAMPGYMVVPPDSTVLAYRSFRMSTSHFMMELKVVSWMPQDSIPKGQNSPSEIARSR